MGMEKIKAADGHELDCWITPPQGDRKGGVVIIQEIFGVTDQLKGVADIYAAEGYEVAIPALFDRQAPGTVVPFDNPIPGRDLMMSSNLDESLADIGAAVARLKQDGGKVGVIGFCWGGGLAIRAAQKLDVDAAVSFYGTRLDQYLDSPLKAPVQGHFGKTDDHTPQDVIDRTKAALPEIELHMYDAGHAFANDVRPAYVPDAAETAHARTKAFLARHLA